MATSNSIENGGFKLLIYGDFYGKGYDSSWSSLFWSTCMSFKAHSPQPLKDQILLCKFPSRVSGTHLKIKLPSPKKLVQRCPLLSLHINY
jgi:hypothetical protein